MSRIYEDKPLQSIPVKQLKVSNRWNPAESQSGNGILVEGCVSRICRYQITDINEQKLKRSHKRQYDRSGKEIEPNFSETKKVSTGFLNSSYKDQAKGQTDRLSHEQVATLVQKHELSRLLSLESQNGSVWLWMKEQSLNAIDMEAGGDVRIKTKGDSPFIETLAKITSVSSTVSNFAGDSPVGGFWTDKVMSFKAQQDVNKSLPQDTVDGVDEDEWDD